MTGQTNAKPPAPRWFRTAGAWAPKVDTEVPNTSCSGLINLGNVAAGVDYRGGTLAYAEDMVNKRPYRPDMHVKKGEILVNDNVEELGAQEGPLARRAGDRVRDEPARRLLEPPLRQRQARGERPQARRQPSVVRLRVRRRVSRPRDA